MLNRFASHLWPRGVLVTQMTNTIIAQPFGFLPNQLNKLHRWLRALHLDIGIFSYIIPYVFPRVCHATPSSNTIMLKVFGYLNGFALTDITSYFDKKMVSKEAPDTPISGNMIYEIPPGHVHWHLQSTNYHSNLVTHLQVMKLKLIISLRPTYNISCLFVSYCLTTVTTYWSRDTSKLYNDISLGTNKKISGLTSSTADSYDQFITIFSFSLNVWSFL